MRSPRHPDAIPVQRSRRRWSHCLGSPLLGVALALTLTSPVDTRAVSSHQDGSATCSLAQISLPLFDATPPAAVIAAEAASPASEASRTPTSEEAADIRAAFDTIVACLNAGNPRQIYAVFSEHYLATQYADPSRAYLPAFEQALSGPIVQVDPPYTLAGVTDIRMIGIDRAQATVTLSRLTETWTDTLILVHVNDAWLIDAVVS